MNMTNQKNNQSIRTSEDHDHEPARQARSRSDHCSLLSSYSFPRENATKVTCLLCTLPSLVSARPFKKKTQGSGHKSPSIGITRAWQNLLGKTSQNHKTPQGPALTMSKGSLHLPSRLLHAQAPSVPLVKALLRETKQTIKIYIKIKQHKTPPADQRT